MAAPALVRTKIYEGVGAEERLADLGLDVRGLERIILQGEYARVEATENDPLGAGGMDAYRYRVRAFRDTYLAHGWTRDRDRGLELTVSPCGRHAVITRGGDSGVGLRDAFPQPTGKIGETTRTIVDMNADLLFDANWMNVTSGTVTGTPKNSEKYDTRILLVYRSGDIVRSELSLPSEMEENETGTVLGWVERIILPTIDLTDERYRKSPPSEDIADVQPKITRKR